MRNRSMFRICLLAVIMLMPLLQSCENAFPNDRLDNFWRLETIEYSTGQTESPENTTFSFARHIVVIEDHQNGFYRHGQTTDTGDSIKLDYSMYPASQTETIKAGLNRCGIDSLVTTFKVEYPKNRLVLSNDRVTLGFIKW